jgi:hypothetical protein
VDARDFNAPVAAGLAEIANANFYSEDTLTGQYPSPTDVGLIPVNLAKPLGKVRRYFSRPAGQGLLPANPLRAECVTERFGLFRRFLGPVPYPCTDPFVWDQVASHMLPRAVGYARGVLDYFFRGSIAVTSVEWTPEGVMVSVRNMGSEEMDGVFEMYARYQPGTPQERRVKFATLGDGDSIVLGAGEEWSGTIDVPLDAGARRLRMSSCSEAGLGSKTRQWPGRSLPRRMSTCARRRTTPMTAPECAPLPHRQAPQPYESGATLSIVSDAIRCDWRINGHRVGGVLQTNMPVDPATNRREPIIERVEASWIGGDAEGPAPLVIDGRDVDSIWQRTGLGARSNDVRHHRSGVSRARVLVPVGVVPRWARDRGTDGDVYGRHLHTCEIDLDRQREAEDASIPGHSRSRCHRCHRLQLSE